MGTMNDLRGLAVAARMMEQQKRAAEARKPKAVPVPPVIQGSNLPGTPGRGLQSRVTNVGRRLRGDPARFMLENMPADLLAKMSGSQRAFMEHALKVLDGVVQPRRAAFTGPIRGKTADLIVLDDPIAYAGVDLGSEPSRAARVTGRRGPEGEFVVLGVESVK